MKLRYLKETISKEKMSRLAFNEACNVLVMHGLYKSTYSAENSILTQIKKSFNIKNDEFFGLATDKIITEAMTTEEEVLQMVAGNIPWVIASARNNKKYVNPFTSGHAFSEVIRILSKNLSRELRNRLTCSEKPNNSQKTEGGEG